MCRTENSVQLVNYFVDDSLILPWIVLKQTEIDDGFGFVVAERFDNIFWAILRPILQVADRTGVEID